MEHGFIDQQYWMLAILAEDTFATGSRMGTLADATPAVLQTNGKSARASRLTKADVLETPVFCLMLLS